MRSERTQKPASKVQYKNDDARPRAMKMILLQKAARDEMWEYKEVKGDD
jgi:hypothetical protein